MAIRRSISDTVQVSDWSRDIPGALSADRLTWLFPVVRGISRGGKETKWLVSVRIYANIDAANDANGTPLVITEAIARNEDKSGTYVAQIRIHYQMGSGVVQARTPTYVSGGKKRGTVGETNVFCQALRDALSLYNKQRRRARDDDEFISRPLPMLAQVLRDNFARDEDVPMPVYVQRKYNGVRAIGTIDDDRHGLIYSRTGLAYVGFNTLRELISRIVTTYADRHNGAQLYLDGELYKHGAPLQEISGIVRRVQGTGLDAQTGLTYVIYDIFWMDDDNRNKTFAQRWQVLRDDISPIIDHIIGSATSRPIVVADTYRCENMTKVREYYDQFLRENYEGAIVRLDRAYDHAMNARHSPYLLKIKPTYDSEFEIVGWTVGDKGKARGALLFICVAIAPDNSRHEFNVTPTGTIESRIVLAREFARMEANGRTVFENNWKGKQLIVKYDELNTATGVPQRARTDSEIRELP